MNKRYNRVLFFLSILGITFSSSGCDFGGALKGKEGTLKISAFEGGTGATVWQKLADAYIRHNPRAKIEINCTPLVRDECQTAVETARSDTDIFFIDGCTTMKGIEYYHSIANIAELYSSTPKAGDQEENITIAEKIRPEVLEMMKYTGDMPQYQGGYYTAPWLSGPAGLILNMDALDNALGKGNWSTPRTTNELLDLCDRIVAADAKVKINGVNNKVYPFIYSSAVSYWRYLYYTWIAQYMGFDNYTEEFLKVKIDGEYNIEAFFSEGKYKGFEEIEKIIKRENGYCDPVSLGNKFMASQKYFLQGRACMYVTGDWFEREMEGSSYTTNMKMVKTPMISSFVTPFENKFNFSLGATAAEKETKLCAIIDAIDNGDSSFEGLTAEQYAYARECRGYCFTLAYGSYCLVMESSVNKEMAIDFLRFYYSDEGIQIVLDDTKSLLPVINADNYEISGDISDFRRTVNEIYFNENFRSISGLYNDPIRYRGGLGEHVNNETPEAAMGKKSGAMTAVEYLARERVLLTARWDDILRYVSEK
ncbi:MAG: ABC transporter substrate-binding protein [Bacilli bacterium]|jgi:ABC-type glycerol-3-phosphate transport system substrate-binding protein